MSKNKTYEQRLKEVLSGIRKASKDTGEHPGLITKAQFKKAAPKVTEWDLRAIGGYASIQKTHFPLTGKDLAEIQKNNQVKNYVAKLERELGDKINLKKEALAVIEKAFKQMKPKKYKVPRKKSVKGKKMAMELMLSDIHFGKKTKTFNLAILRKRLEKLTATFLDELKKKQKEGYNVNQLIISLIGDIIESYTMHGSESSIGCEFGNSVQMQQAIDCLFDLVFLPLAMTGINIHVPAVAGNHDRTEKNRTYNNPGENYVTWVIYNSLKRYCQLSGLKNITFDIPVDSYTTYDLFGKHTMLFEHLDNISSPTKKICEVLMKKRGDQTGKVVKMLRGGHWHEYVCFDRGKIIINESGCGQDSFAKVKGYVSRAGQTINFYVDDDSMPNGFLYSYPVNLE